MNIIFLDVDHVLNSVNKLIEVYKKTGRPHSGYAYPFDEKCLRNLKLIVQETDAKIVITSTWRKDGLGRITLSRILKKHDLDDIVIGLTPILPGKERGDEIKQFLSGLSEIPNFVILDNDSDMGELTPFLVKTNWRVGLTEENVREAIEKLKSVHLQNRIEVK